MPLENSTAPAQPATEKKKKPAWYDWLIDIFKMLLGYNYLTYGTKKKF
ncbi:hypothetical protein [Desulfopila sp. IMCC35006]|nr:hypothetical protein [Desulfopila sp. IMCC35006]